MTFHPARRWMVSGLLASASLLLLPHASMGQEPKPTEQPEVVMKTDVPYAKGNGAEL